MYKKDIVLFVHILLVSIVLISYNCTNYTMFKLYILLFVHLLSVSIGLITQCLNCTSCYLFVVLNTIAPSPAPTPPRQRQSLPCPPPAFFLDPPPSSSLSYMSSGWYIVPPPPHVTTYSDRVWILDRAVPIGTLSTNWYSRRSIIDGSEVVGWPCSSGKSCSIWCCPPYIRRATPRIHECM